MIEAVIDWVRGAVPKDRRPQGGFVASMYRASPKAVIVLVDAAGTPTAMVKVARQQAAEPALVAEFEALRQLASHRSDWLRKHAPAPIALGRVSDLLALAQSFVRGTPMTARYYTPGHTRTLRRVARDFDDAGRWLARFQQETAVQAQPLDDEMIERFVADPIVRYRAEIGWSDTEEELFAGALRRAQALRGTPMPLMGVHGDFWMGNLLVGRAGIEGVVDWEQASFRSNPMHDVYKFPTSYSFYLDRASPGARRVPGHPGWAEARERWGRYGEWANLPGFGYGFFGSGWYPSLVRTWIEGRTAALGLGPVAHSIFFPVFLARQAVTLADPVFRYGYRDAIVALGRERSTSWLWGGRSLEREKTVLKA